ILENNEGLDRLVIGRRPFLSRHFDDRSRHRYFLSGTCPLLFTLRLWLRKRQRRKQCAADEDGNWFLHVMPPVDVNGCTRWLLTLYKGIPERVLHEFRFFSSTVVGFVKQCAEQPKWARPVRIGG